MFGTGQRNPDEMTPKVKVIWDRMLRAHELGKKFAQKVRNPSAAGIIACKFYDGLKAMEH